MFVHAAANVEDFRIADCRLRIAVFFVCHLQS
jgi:hypothetical protein